MSLFDFFKKNEAPEKPAAETVENVPQMLHVKFLFEQPARLDNEQLAIELGKEFARFDQGDNDGRALLYFFPDYSVQYQDGQVPAQGSILLPEQPAFKPDSVATALTQSWHWPEAAAVVGACRYEFLVTDLMSRGLEHPRRVEYF